MATIQEIRQTVEALSQFVEKPGTKLCLSYKGDKAVALAPAESVSGSQCFLSYFGKSTLSFRSIVEFLHQSGGFFTQINEANIRDRDWKVINQAIDMLRGKIGRYNQKGFRPRSVSLQLQTFAALVVPPGVDVRLRNEIQFTHTLREMQATLVGEAQPSYSQLLSITQTLKSICTSPLPQETLQYAHWLEELIEAHLLAEKFPHYCSPYKLSKRESTLTPLVVPYGDSLFESFSKFLQYTNKKYREVANEIEQSEGKEAAQEQVGDPPYKDLSVNNLRLQVADYFEKNIQHDRQLRILLFYSMLQQNRSIQKVAKSAAQYIEAHPSSSFDKTSEEINTIVRFKEFYGYDLHTLSDAMKKYTDRTKESGRWSSLVELYALIHISKLQVNLLQVTMKSDEEGAADRDLEAEKLLVHPNEDDRITESSAKWDETFQLLFVNGEEFCLENADSPVYSPE